LEVGLSIRSTRRGEHRAAFAVEVAAEDVDELDQPLRERAPALRHTPIRHSRRHRRRGEFARDARMSAAMPQCAASVSS